MNSSKAAKRQTERERWLRENPVTHRWLREQKSGSLHFYAKHPLAKEMVEDLKRRGFYSVSTVAMDICSAMRRAAVTVNPDEMTPNELAYLEISRILEREGVCVPAVIARLCTLCAGHPPIEPTNHSNGKENQNREAH
jgi:hypothetical protein